MSAYAVLRGHRFKCEYVLWKSLNEFANREKKWWR